MLNDKPELLFSKDAFRIKLFLEYIDTFLSSIPAIVLLRLPYHVTLSYQDKPMVNIRILNINITVNTGSA